MTIDENELALRCHENGIRMVVLFGSHAPRGLTPRPDSDVDLAVAMHRTPEQRGIFHLHAVLADLFPGRNLDLVNLAGVDPLFRWEVMNFGILLFGDPDEFAELRAFAFRDFIDSADLRRLEYTLFEKKMTMLEKLNATH